MDYREHGWRVTVEMAWQGGSEGQEEEKKASRAIKDLSSPLRPRTQASNMEFIPKLPIYSFSQGVGEHGLGCHLFLSAHP